MFPSQPPLMHRRAEQPLETGRSHQKCKSALQERGAASPQIWAWRHLSSPSAAHLSSSLGNQRPPTCRPPLPQRHPMPCSLINAPPIQGSSSLPSRMEMPWKLAYQPFQEGQAELVVMGEWQKAAAFVGEGEMDIVLLLAPRKSPWLCCFRGRRGCPLQPPGNSPIKGRNAQAAEGAHWLSPGKEPAGVTGLEVFSQAADGALKRRGPQSEGHATGWHRTVFLQQPHFGVFNTSCITPYLLFTSQSYTGRPWATKMKGERRKQTEGSSLPSLSSLGSPACQRPKSPKQNRRGLQKALISCSPTSILLHKRLFCRMQMNI